MVPGVGYVFIPIRPPSVCLTPLQQGDWDLAYTNAAMLPIGPRLKVYEQFQRIEPGDGVKVR